MDNITDEISNFQLSRYIGTNEAYWRIFEFPIHERFPSVFQLDVHLENGQRVYFNIENIHTKLINPKDTTLTAFFKLCQIDEFAKTILYVDVPSYYSFNQNKWIKRLIGKKIDQYSSIRKSTTIGRIYAVHISNAECFYLRVLLNHVKGPTSFKYLKTFENMAYF